METKVMNYRIIVEKEPHKKATYYVAYAPTLGISDFGKSIDEALLNVKKAISLYLQTLIDLRKAIPRPDIDEYVIANSQVTITYPAGRLAYL